jgi:hypothetical protein
MVPTRIKEGKFYSRDEEPFEADLLANLEEAKKETLLKNLTVIY